uniref:Uncharacterized protein n=1 Tax=Anguilla anguilla TaxID=7936 RepID=A0A0E9PQ33_ANGAN
MSRTTAGTHSQLPLLSTHKLFFLITQKFYYHYC